MRPSKFFEDGRASRPLVAETVARGHLKVDRSFYTGREGTPQSEMPNSNTATKPADDESKNLRSAATRAAGDTVGAFVENAIFVEKIPIPVNESVLNYGYQRYMIYCVVCHDPLGTGYGKIIERGYTAPPSFHIDRLRNAPVGRLFAVVSEGYGSMPSYAAQIPTEDRWAIVAYVKALQLSQHFPVAELTPEMSAALANATSTGTIPQRPSAPKEESQ